MTPQTCQENSKEIIVLWLSIEIRFKIQHWFSLTGKIIQISQNNFMWSSYNIVSWATLAFVSLGWIIYNTPAHIVCYYYFHTISNGDLSQFSIWHWSPKYTRLWMILAALQFANFLYDVYLKNEEPAISFYPQTFANIFGQQITSSWLAQSERKLLQKSLIA